MASVAAPHYLAEEAGLAILAEGGTAVEAAVAMAAVLTVCYPAMTGLGGDGFWLIAEPGQDPVAIRACGPAGNRATPQWYRDRGMTTLPSRGPEAALTVGGAVGGWDLALGWSKARGGRLPLVRLLESARRLALVGTPVARSQAELTAAKKDELFQLPGFREAFAPRGLPQSGDLQVQPKLAVILERLGREGLDSFYRGALAEDLAADLADLGSPLELDDFAQYRPAWVPPLSVKLSVGQVWNLPAPTQGPASLAILGIFDRLQVHEPDSFAHIHGLVEATKTAFTWRDRGAPHPEEFLGPDHLDKLAQGLPRQRATPWPRPADPGDTVWFGAADDQGRTVSVIQSLYWEFGAGIVLPRTGLLWQNRGTAFTLDPGPRQLKPGDYPFHTLNPALARLNDGRTVAYGTMGGEGQPQTQAAFLTRYAWFGQSLKEAIDSPRWLLGRTWGESTTSLRVESRWDARVTEALVGAGHPVEVVGPWDDRMGHAGAVVTHPDGRTEAAHDARADGGGQSLGALDPSWDLERFLANLARFGAEPDGGVTRLLYDDAWSGARNWLAEEFLRLGLEPRDDAVGNLYGRLTGTSPDSQVILTGSHFDTVRHGGWYDGAYGIAASAVALADLRRRHGPPLKTIEVVAFAEEEGSRFPLTYWGSGNLAGRWSSDYPAQEQEASGISLFDARASAGFGLPSQPKALRTDLAAYIELHIEQGIVLERQGTRIGIVEAIVGQKRWLVRVTGEANHAGTTPMKLRRDALAGAVAMMAVVETEARHRGAPLVATVGFVEVSPNTPNVIPGSVAFTVDARHVDAAALAAFREFLDTAFASIASERGLSLDIESRMTVDPAPMDRGLRDQIQGACQARALSYQTLPSGAGHDAQVLAKLCPTAMIFIPSRKGLSHSPLEYSSHQALADGLGVLSDVLYQLAWKGTTP